MAKTKRAEGSLTPEQRSEISLRQRAYLEGWAEGAATFNGKRAKARTVDRHHADYQLGLEHGRIAAFQAGEAMARQWRAALDSTPLEHQIVTCYCEPCVEANCGFPSEGPETRARDCRSGAR